MDRPKLLDGSLIKKGDLIIGLPSTGLHTNGYSLARKVLFDQLNLPLSAKPEGFSKTLGEELLRVHKNYQPALAALPSGLVKGLAHITGGGLIDNLPRVLPSDLDAVIDTGSWKVPPIFKLIESGGKIDREEMYQVFNMGIGMTVVVRPKDAAAVAGPLKGKVIGQIAQGTGVTRLEFR